MPSIEMGFEQVLELAVAGLKQGKVEVVMGLLQDTLDQLTANKSAKEIELGLAEAVADREAAELGGTGCTGLGLVRNKQ